MKLQKVAEYAKAVAGGLVTAAAAYTQATTDGHVTTQEWWTVLVAALVGAGLVGAVPNRKPPA